MTVRRRRGLTEEDAALWAQVVETVSPLKRRRRVRKRPLPPDAAAAPEPEPEPPARSAAPVRVKPSLPPPKIPRRPAIPPLSPIDRQERRRLVRGARPLDGRIDLHGMRQAEAHDALRGFLAYAQMRGQKVVLVITGKGGSGGPALGAGERGVLRRLVPHWLGMPDLRSVVLGFEEAHPGHGGSGALYVHLRRAKRGGAAS